MKKTTKETYTFDNLSEIVVAICRGEKVVYTHLDSDNNLHYSPLSIHENILFSKQDYIDLSTIPEELFNMSVEEMKNNSENMPEELSHIVDDLLYYVRDSAIIYINGSIYIGVDYDIEKRKNEVIESNRKRKEWLEEQKKHLQ